MDVIIFFEKKRNISEPELSVQRRSGYCLLRVGINGSGSSWFGRPLPQCPGQKCEEQEGGLRVLPGERRENEERRGGLCALPGGRREDEERKDGLRVLPGGRRENEEWAGGLRGLLKRLKKRKVLLRERKEAERQMQEAQRERENQRAAYEAAILALEKDMTELSGAIRRRIMELDTCACVYTADVRPLFAGEGISAAIWERVCGIEEFSGYAGLRWANQLLAYVQHAELVVLGTEACFPQLLVACARRLKSVCWVLPQGEETEEMQEFAEDFYEEYGLAIAIYTIAGRNAFRTLCLEAGEPVCVMDFSRETKIGFNGLPSGSVWLDFASDEEKERRLGRMAPGICYRSLKRLWHEEPPAIFLDSGAKSGYNTGVKG